MEKDFIFLILQYNNVDVTINCVQSIFELKRRNRIRIVIVDNNSTDGAKTKIVDYMRKQCQEIVCSFADAETDLFLFEHISGCAIDILGRTVNDGFSKGNNFGFRYIEKKYFFKFLIVSNSDVMFFQNEFIELVERVYEKTMFDVLGPDIWQPYKKIHQNPLALDIPNLKTVNKTIFLNRICLVLFPLISPWIEKYVENIKNNFTTNAIEGTGICLQGSCLIYSNKYIEFRKKKMEQIIGNTLFYPETSFYYEEFLQTLWCKNNGCKIVYFPDLKVCHLEGQSTNTVSTSKKKKLKFKMKNILQAAQIYRKELLKYY